jgi:hypothetical protein
MLEIPNNEALKLERSINCNKLEKKLRVFVLKKRKWIAEQTSILQD